MSLRYDPLSPIGITGDNYIKIDEIGVPISMARALQIPETVRDYNKDELNAYYMNKRNTYPGCSGVLRKASGTFHSIDHADAMDYQLQDGDIVYRDIIDGDYIGFNRQPSLLFGQIGSHRVKVMEKGLTLRINVSACAPYNADFDGDACNALVAQNIQSRFELQNLSWIGNWTISYQNSAPYFGCFQDSLIGSAEMTRSDVKMDKWHAMKIFGNVTPPDGVYDFDAEYYTGRDIVSKFLPKINYPKKRAKMYVEQYAPFIKYDPDEIYVQIERGKLISGSLDKATVGQGVMGSIFQIINNEYGSNVALDTIYNFQQATTEFFHYKGFTVGIEDINISEPAIKKIKEKTKAMLIESRDITEKLNRRELIPPIGTSLKDFYEMEQLNSLQPGDDFVEPILSDINFKTNALAKMVYKTGKGKPSNMISINGAQGQMTTNGNRPLRNFSWGRTSPYFPRYDTSPVSLGYIENSLREGTPPESFPFASGEARNGAIGNALSTSISGAQSRLNIKNLESIVTDNTRKAVKDVNIIQPLYAESGVDTRKTEKVKFLTALISDKEMKENYHSTVKMFDSTYRNKQVTQILDEEYEQLIKDREMYREIFFGVENNNPKQYLVDNELQMPVNPFRVIENVLYNYADIHEELSKEELILDPVKSIKAIEELCDLLPYAYYNRIQEDQRGKIPEYINEAVLLLKILIRTYLCTSNLVRKKINNYYLSVIIKKIKMSFKNSLMDYGVAVGIIAAQCLSAPLLQFVLDSKHRTGGGGTHKTNAIVRIKEIFGAKGTEKMKNTSMLIIVKKKYEKNKLKVQEIANKIEMMDFDRFVIVKQIFFEEYGNPLHSLYRHESKMIQSFEKYNQGIPTPSNLSKWCIRYVLDKEQLIMNNMKLDTIMTKLRIEYPDIHFVYSPQNSDSIIIRCYISNNMIKIPSSGFSIDIIKKIMCCIGETIIRGIRGIIYTEITNVAMSEIAEDGSVQTTKTYGIQTVGTNLAEVIDNPYVDPYRTQTDSIKEYEEMFGIEATHNKIINEIRKALSSGDVIYQHCSVFASEMTYSGSMTSIQKTGLQKRESENIPLQLSFQSQIQILESAAINGAKSKVTGISGALLFGQTPRLGTTFNDVRLNRGFVEDYMKNLSQSIEDDL